MKTRKIEKKLTLKKETVTDLGRFVMKDVQGGLDLSKISYCVGCPTNRTCNTCAPETCACHGETYETCNYYMCNTIYPFPCI